jgi:hypothetical protein
VDFEMAVKLVVYRGEVPLLFAPDSTPDFDRVVFNTEAHPLRRTW